MNKKRLETRKNITVRVSFKSRIVASAYDAFYHDLIKRLSFEPVKYVDYRPIELRLPDAPGKGTD
ncbi:MAG: hypothetical protein LBF60_07900 [Treponema sp.]|nr:hypothetical protein [Treponema sp.]